MEEIDKRFLRWVDNTISTYEDTPIELKSGYITIPFSMLKDLNDLFCDLQKDLAIKEEDCYNKRDECEMYKESYDYAEKSLITEHCTMNHQENTEYEKGQINGFITALTILRKAFRKTY